MTFSAPSSGLRALTLTEPPGRLVTHWFQCVHHEPGFWVAPARNSSGSSGSLPSVASLVQKPYLLADGGLTMPAIWPEPPRTNLVGPDGRRAPMEVLCHGAMWSSMVEMK